MIKLKSYIGGKQNFVNNLSIINKKQILEIENRISNKVKKALYCPDSGVIDPFNLTYGFAENAYKNGVQFFFETEVKSLEKARNSIILSTNKGKFETRYVVNAAGLNSAYDGNTMIGPTSERIDPNKEVDQDQSLEYLDKLSKKSIENINFDSTIRVFTGVRAKPDTGDFMIYSSNNMKGLIHAGGIESPGLVSSPAIALHVIELLGKEGLEQEWDLVRALIVVLRFIKSLKVK